MGLRERREAIKSRRGEEKDDEIKDEVSNKIPAIAESLHRLVTKRRDDGIFLDVLKANFDSGFGKVDPTSQLGLWDMSLAADLAFRGLKDEMDKAESIVAMEKALLQMMPDEESEGESATFITNQLLKIFRRELQNVKKEKR